MYKNLSSSMDFSDVLDAGHLLMIVFGGFKWLNIGLLDIVIFAFFDHYCFCI